MKTVPKASVTKLVRGIAELKASDRMFRLKKIILEEPRYVDITQALLVTASYKKTEGRPKIIQRALAFGHVIDNLPLRIYEGELIVGNRTYGSRWGVVSPEAGISWLEKEIDTIDTRPQDPFTFRDEDKKRFREEIVHYWKGKSLEDRIMEEHGTEIKAISKVVKVNQLDHAQGHIIADVPLWLKLGIVGMEDRVKRAMAGKSSESQPGLYESMLISLDAARRFMLRYAHYAENLAGMETDEHRAAELREIGRICAKISNDPPSTFHEALQSIWFLFVLLDTESNASSFSFGRMDQYLYRFFIADIESGALSLDFARDLLESFWLCCNKIVYMRNREGARYFAGFPIGFNIVIGGQLADGSDGTNALSYLCLKAQDHLRLPQPNLSVRLYEKSPEEFVDACSRVIGGGGGMPQIFSDTSIIPALEKQGISHTDAVNYAVVGCVELSCSGNYLGWSDAAMFNLVKALELALNGGKCLISGESIGPDLGDLEQFEDYRDMELAFKGQIDYFFERMMDILPAVERAHCEVLPSPFLSTVIDDCIGKGVDVTAGGADYNFSGIQAIQVANIADSLAAIKFLVYDRKLVDRSALLSALRNNFKDAETLRQFLINQAPKYGNDVEWVDLLGLKWIRYFDDRLAEFRNARGGKYITGLYTVSAHVPMGANVGASADGRLASSPLADGGVSAMYGRDINGPTALLNSVSRISSVQVGNGTLLNMKFLPEFFSDNSRAKFNMLLCAFIRLKIHHVQFNVVRKEDLLAAKRNPELHRGLIVRVAGYTAYFTQLAAEIQDEIIARTTYGVDDGRNGI